MAHETDVYPAIGGKVHAREIDAAIAGLAARQHGVVAYWQLARLGVSRRAVEHRVARGLLHPLYRAVFAFGRPDVTVQGRWMAAVLAGGEGAVLSHRSGAAHWGILQTARAAIEVTTPRQRRSRGGLEFHGAALPPDEVTVHDGIPITTVPRTIFDLAAVERPSRVDQAFNEAETRRLTDELSLSDLLERYPRARGTRTIRAMLATAPEGITREELEHRFREFVDDYALPRPKFNHHIRVGDRLIEADCVWLEQKRIVELDGYATHGTRRAFESDRLKDRVLAVNEWRVIRVTWRQLRDDPGGLAADLGTLLRLAA